MTTTTLTNGSQQKVKHFNDYPNDVGFSDIPETITPVEMKVTGAIPDYVRGVLYRTGPGSYTTPLNNGKTFKIQHWYNPLFSLADSGSTDLTFSTDSK
jgi:carotenoid cleavage dioxygenase-like enzyme